MRWAFSAGKVAFVTGSILVIHSASAQSSQQQSAASSGTQMQMQGMQMPAMAGPDMNDAGMYLMNRASGTGANPESAVPSMLSRSMGGWNFMLHGQGFISDVQQTGPRGADKFFSTNWFMGMAEHDLGEGAFTFRAMVSLEPATVSGRMYPELFQTGETALGRPIVDGQHPHDLFMELSFAYARSFGEKTNLELYFAPIGDPALGPVGFPHRVSAEELPQAPLSHHLQDSTHIADEVITGAFRRPHWGLEVSGFHGAEPNENRWNIDAGKIDSWSGRLTWTPTKNWSAQVSTGRLTHPEAAEPGDVLRSTASVTYDRPFEGGHWATSAIWGRNHKTQTKQDTNSYLLESVIQFRKSNFFTGRIELVDKDELFSDEPLLDQQLRATTGDVFRIGAYTTGYTRDLNLVPHVSTGLGGNFTLYSIADALRPFYGSRPAAFYLYVRFKLHGKEDQSRPGEHHNM
jgi:hypothetical protein